MEIKKYVSLNGISIYLDNLRKIFATKESVSNIEQNMDTYILNVDYSVLEFDTGLIVSGGASSAVMGVGELGTIVLGSS